MSVENINQLFGVLHDSSILIQEALEFSYIEALFESLQNLADGEVQQIDNRPTDEEATKLREIYDQINIENLSAEDIRKAIQFAFIEGEKADQLQANYQMTPEAIAILIAYFATKLMDHKVSTEQANTKEINLFDPTIGTGNLYAITYNALEDAGYTIKGAGYDNDDLLLSIADVATRLQDIPAQLYLGDSLQNLIVAPNDVIVADLPLGYYPIDEVANTYSAAKNRPVDGHAYVHYLMVEQGLRYLKPNGWGIFIVPAGLIQDKNIKNLIQAIGEYGYFQALLSLPGNLFTSEKTRKAVLLVQKAGDHAKQSENILIGEIPDLKSKEELPKFLNSFDVFLERMK
jgi:site-specific DNA-methyltransferase (adenine-specific)